jgi:outer membrane protein assembly factor BamA
MRYSYLKYHVTLFFLAVILENFNLFCQDSLTIDHFLRDSSGSEYTIGTINIIGNQKTHNLIISRELTFKEGDCMNKISLENAIEQSKTNLLKLPLFNYVSIEIVPISQYLININIVVEERWFIWPQVAIINNERNFNSWFQDKDFSKLDYRLAVKQYNVLGLNHIIRVGVSVGYTREISLGYQNIAIDKKQKHLIGLYSRYSQYYSVFYRTFKNRQESFTNTQSNVLEEKYFRLNYDFRPQLNFHHRISLSLQYLEVSDSLRKTNPEYLAGTNNQNSFLELIYQFTIDKRDSRSYPLSGFWFDVAAVKTGLKLQKESTVNYFNIRALIKQYYHIAGRFFGANSFTVKKSFENSRPYYYKEGLGYDDFLRGFEYYVIDGEDYYLSKNVLKFELLPKTISYLNFIPLKKFKKIHYALYTNIYFDIGYAHEKNPEEILQNTLSDQILFSGGLGVDLATYYDKVLRIEFSMNSLKESGVFIHIIAPI